MILLERGQDGRTVWVTECTVPPRWLVVVTQWIAAACAPCRGSTGEDPRRRLTAQFACPPVPQPDPRLPRGQTTNGVLSRKAEPYSRACGRPPALLTASFSPQTLRQGRPRLLPLPQPPGPAGARSLFWVSQ